jgi:hypothetical protein
MSIGYAARAQELVGRRFRAQGRGEGGLDCVGVVLATFDIPNDQVRRDYRLRGNHLLELREGLGKNFRRVAKAQLRAGDVLVLKAGDDQLHLAVKTLEGYVHAHAGLRRVVETPGVPQGPLLGIYRKRRGR